MEETNKTETLNIKRGDVQIATINFTAMKYHIKRCGGYTGTFPLVFANENDDKKCDQFYFTLEIIKNDGCDSDQEDDEEDDEDDKEDVMVSLETTSKRRFLTVLNIPLKFSDIETVICKVSKTLTEIHMCCECKELFSSKNETKCVDCSRDECMKHPVYERCSICQGDINCGGFMTGCGHHFHEKCIRKLIYEKMKEDDIEVSDVPCPECRAGLSLPCGIFCFD